MKIGVKHLPFVIVVLLILTVCITLILTLRADHVANGLPYISDTGTLPPESCVFGQALNLLWVLFSCTIYVKYRQTEYLFNRHSIKLYMTLNKSAFYVGLLAAFGCSIVGNFQETNVLFIHWIGAVLVFGFGAIYQCIQTLLYVNLLSLTLIMEQRKITNLRIVLTALSVTTFLIFFICGMGSFAKKTDYDYLRWRLDEGGYYLHNISAGAEWICAASTTIYLTMFYWEFSKITIQQPDVFVEDESATTGNSHGTTEALQNK